MLEKRGEVLIVNPREDGVFVGAVMHFCCGRGPEFLENLEEVLCGDFAKPARGEIGQREDTVIQRADRVVRVNLARRDLVKLLVGVLGVNAGIAVLVLRVALYVAMRASASVKRKQALRLSHVLVRFLRR